MSRHQALQDRLSAIEAQLSLSTSRRAVPSRPGSHTPGAHRTRSFRRDAGDSVSPVLQALLAEVLPGALMLDWRQDAGGHSGRMAAEGLVFRFRVDGAGVGYRPAWEGLRQRGWELRSDSFLELRAPALRPTARMDFRRSGAGVARGQKRKCSTGYSCGSTCISLQKECRLTPASAMGKARLRRLQQLAAGGDKAAEATASQVSASRGAAAVERQKERNTKRVEKLLARPEIAEFLRTGKLPQAASSSTEPGTVRNMKPGEITFDPGRFQYKLNASSSTGEVGSLSGVRKWDPNLAGVMSVWKDPADGKIYVVNGHNRLSLATRLGAEEVTVRFLNAANATEARAIGAMQNIAEGAGTPMDAAKFFRDTGIKTQADVEARGLPLGSGQAEKGMRLSKLPTDVFNAVVRGDLSVNRGAIIGGSGLDEAKQREVFKMIGSRKGIADQTLLELVEHAAASQQRTQTTMSLFGETQEAKDNLITRAKLSAALKSKIAREKRLFGTVSKAKAATSLTEKGGNVINQEQSAKVAGEASEALAVFERLKSSSGPISSALNRAADRVEAGESEGKVRQELERDVFAAVEEELVAAGLRKRPRADSLQARLDALKRRCSTGYGCGSACISLRKECRRQPGSSTGKERMKRLLALAAGGPSGQRGIAPVNAGEAGGLAAAITSRRGQQAAQLRGARAQQAAAKPAPDTFTSDEAIALMVMANKKLRSDRSRDAEMLRLGVSPETDLHKLVHTAREKLGGPGWWQAGSGWQDKLKRFAAAAADPKNSVLTNPGRQDPGLAPKGKEQGLTAQEVSTSTQQAAFARQQQQAAKAAGDQRGAQAWRKEERTVERNRLANAINRGNQSQASLFGVTEYDETMPLFQQEVGRNRRDSKAESLQLRIDGTKKKCSVGYGCGASCIPMDKQCRLTPMSAVSKQRLTRLMTLAAGAASPREQEGKSPNERRIAALKATRDQLGKNLVASLSKRRPDGQGNYIEHPDAAAMQQIKSAGLRVAKIDQQLNVLEGKDPEEKRWIDGDPFGLARYSDLQSPGRTAYERKVIASELKGATVGDQAVFMSGGPASGKTSLLKKQFGDAEGFAVIDPDRIKDYDPVMRIAVAMGMRQAAALAHENSSRLSKEVYAAARDRGFNVLMDGTGANAGKYIGQMQELKGKGYQITLLAQHVPEEVGVKRALARADRTGRYVPREFIQHAYEVIPGNFERIAQVADRATLNDGESNQVIMEYQAGRLVGGSRKRTADYRRRYGKPQPA